MDSAGDLYIGDQGNGRVREVTAAGTIGTVAGYGYVTNYSTGQNGGAATSAKFDTASLIALDGAGNLYFADGGDNRILKVTAAAVALNFATTAVGATSTDSPQTVTLNNIGNMALTFPAPGSVGSLNPSLSAGFVYGGSSTCNQIGSTSGGFTLASGSTCTEIVSFVPVAGGTVAGSVTSEDNSLNATSTQAVALNGTGIQLAPTVTAISPAAGPGAGGTSVTITGTNFTGATGVRFGAFASPSFTANSGTSITAIAPANTTGTVDVMVTTAAGTSATSAADQFTYLAAIVAVQSESAIGGSVPTLSATVTFVAGYAPSGAVTFQAGSGSPVTATCTATTSSTETCTAAYPTTGLLNGANTITATLAADSNYNTASGTGTLTTVAASFTAPTEAVGTASPTQTATLVFNTATTLNSTLATAVQVVTQGLTGYDFNYASGSTGTACTPGGSYAAGASCTVTYSFTPKAPGVRQGAILLSSNASTPAVVAAAFLSGTGTGPLAQVTPGLLSTLAGTGAACTGTAACGDGGAAAAAMLNGPQSVVVDAAGNVFFADSNDQRIRKIAAGTGLISTVAGSGVASTYCNTANGDGGAATSATFASSPQSIALDGAGNLYIADTAGHRVRKVSAQTGIITTIAGAISGSGNSCAHDNGDGGLATAASVNAPDGVLVDGAGNVYIADNGNYVRKITASTGIINTIAGTGTGSFSGDGGPGTSATVNGPAQMAMDAAGDLYIADYHNQRVRMLTPAGMITTVAGNGTRSSTGNGGPATSATLDNPNSVALDPAGNLYITEEANHIRKVTAATGVISTVVGNGTAGATGDGGAATAGEINIPEGVGIDGAGNIYVADTNDNKIRVIQSNTGAEAFASTAVGAASSNSPASILLGNIGNSAFSVSSFASSSNSFPITGGTCATGTAGAGSSCSVAVSFKPQTSGAQTATLTFVDSSSTPSQIVTLSGTGVPGTATVTVAANPAIMYGTAFVSLAATVAYAGVAPTGGLTFTAGTGATVAATCSGTSSPLTCTATYPTSALAAGGYTITATMAVDANYTVASGTGTLTIGQATPTVTVRSLSATPGSSPTLTAIVAYAGAQPTGIFTFQLGASGSNGPTLTATCVVASGTTETCSVAYPTSTFGPGSYTATGQLAADNNYAGISGTGTLTVVPASFIAPTEPVGTASAVQTATVTFGATGSGTLGAINVVTQGATGLDYALAPGGTCTVGMTVTPGAACTVNYTFTPAAPGLRPGGVTLYSNASPAALLGTSYLGGTGTGPQGLFTNGVATTIASGFAAAYDMYVDAAGNAYVAQQTSPATLVKVAAGTGAITTLYTGTISGVAVDGAGNIFIGQQNSLLELAGGTGNGVTVATGFAFADLGMSVDVQGNIYVPDSLGNTVWKVSAGTYAKTSYGTGLNHPVGVSVEAAGDMYISDNNNNRIVEVTPGGLQTTVATLASPARSVFDGAGNLYVAHQASTIAKLAPVTFADTELGSGFSSPYALGLDAAGDILVDDFGHGTIVKLDRTSTATLAYGNAAVGSTAGAQTTAIENDGNAALTIASIAASNTNFTVGTPTVTTGSTTSSLISAGTLQIPVSFTPQTAGSSLTGALNITDNTLNVAGTLQQVLLTGTGTAGTPLVTASSVTISYGTASAMLSATLAYSGSISPAGAMTFQVDGGATVAAVCLGTTSPETCTATYSTSTLTATTHTITAMVAADANFNTASGTANLNVTAIAPTISFSVGSPTYGATPFTVAATSNSTGAFTYTLVSGNATVTSAGLVTLTGIGSVTLQATQVAAGSYTSGSQTATFTVNAAAPAISFSAATKTYGAAPFTVSATSNSAAAITYTVVSGNATVTSAGLVTLTGIGSVTLQAAQAAAGDYTAGTQTANFTISAEKPTIAFNVASAVYSATPFPVSATSNSTGAFTYTVVSGNATATSAGVVTLTGVGPVTLQATEAVAGDYTASTAQATFIVSQAGTTTTLTASSASIHPNQTVTLTAQVTPNTSGTPMGSVAFYVNGTILMSVPTTTGVAQLTTLLPPGETAAITAIYSGNANFTASTGAASVVVGAFDFTLTGTGTNAYTVAPGVAAVYGFALAPLYGSYAGPVSFTVTGLPAGAVASFTPSTVAASGGATTVEMTVQTAPPIAHNSGGPLGRGVMLALLLLPFGMKRSVRKKLKGPMLPMLLLLVGMTAALTGCGSSNGFLLQSPQTYTLTVTATSGSLVHTQTVTLIVQ